ncbi:MAG: thioredoxin [Candidatus Komeilibacteria bacterium]
MEREFNDQNFKTEVLEFSGIALVDFWAPWCGPCRMQGPIIGELAKSLDAEKNVKIGKLNVDENPTTSQQQQIMSIPAIKIFFQGKLAVEFVGVQSKEALEQQIKKLLS